MSLYWLCAMSGPLQCRRGFRLQTAKVAYLGSRRIRLVLGVLSTTSGWQYRTCLKIMLGLSVVCNHLNINSNDSINSKNSIHRNASTTLYVSDNFLSRQHDLRKIVDLSLNSTKCILYDFSWITVSRTFKLIPLINCHLARQLKGRSRVSSKKTIDSFL